MAYFWSDFFVPKLFDEKKSEYLRPKTVGIIKRHLDSHLNPSLTVGYDLFSSQPEEYTQ